MPQALFVEEEIDVDGKKPRMLAYRGAIGLIELGRRNREMAWSREHGMSDVLGDVGGFIFDIVGKGIDKIAGLLAGIIKIPTDLISTGVGTVLTTFASIVAEIPIIGDFCATIILAVNSLAQFAITLPENLFLAAQTLGQAFQTLSSDQKSKAWQTAMKLVTGSAPPSLQPAVQKAVTAAPKPSGVSVGASVGEVLAALASIAAPVVGFIAFAR